MNIHPIGLLNKIIGMGTQISLRLSSLRLSDSTALSVASSKVLHCSFAKKKIPAINNLTSVILFTS